MKLTAAALQTLHGKLRSFLYIAIARFQPGISCTLPMSCCRGDSSSLHVGAGELMAASEDNSDTSPNPPGPL